MTYRILGSLALVSLLAVGCASDDLGEGLCNAQQSRDDLCDTANPCNAAIAAAASTGGACEAELAAVTAGAGASYRTCTSACPTDETCMFGVATVNYYECSCVTDCVRAEGQAYQDAVSAFAACLEAQASVSDACL